MSIRYPSTVFIFLLLLWVKAIFPPSSGIADTDFYWHLTYGEWIVKNGALPTGDIFSWTFTGVPYQLTQWLGETVMGLFYLLGGLDGTKSLSVFLTAITLWFSWKAAERYVHPSMAFCLAVMCNLVQIVTPMRPQLFTFALLSVSIWLITGWFESNKRRCLLLYPLMMAWWVNLHGGFIVGLVLIGLAATGVTIESIVAKRVKADLRRLSFVWAIVLASLAATMVNPYGYKAITTVLMIGGLRSSTVISEWMPVNLTTELGWFYLINLVPFVALLVVSRERPRIAFGLIAGFFLVFGVLANRQVAMCAAVMAPLTASLLSKTAQYKKMVAGFSDPSRPALFGVISLGLMASFPAIAAIGNGTWEATMNGQYPVLATDFLEKNDLSKRVLSDTLEASYLIHRRIPVFIDGRMDLYRDGFFFSWLFASRGSPGWDALITKYQPSAMLLRQDMAIRQAALAGGNWKQVYEDPRYSILVPTSSSLATVPPSSVAYVDADGRPLRPFTP